ncbi:MAG: glycosyltransferase [Candidatus Aenigmatarchaeota archaeon]
MSLLIISYPFGSVLGGGSKRAFYVLKEFIKKIDVKVFVPFRAILEVYLLSRKNSKILPITLKNLKYLEKKGVEFFPQTFEYLENERLVEFFFNKFLQNKFDLFTYLINLDYFEKVYLEKHKIEEEKFEFIYTPHETFEFIYTTYLFSKKLNLKCSFLFQAEPFFRISHFYRLFKFRKVNTLISYFLGRKSKEILSKMIKENRINKIILVSLAPKILSGFKFQNTKVLTPANAFDKKLLKYRKFKKENYLVFFARLVPEKGIYEIPIVARKLKEVGFKEKILIFGNFPNKEIEKNFYKLVEKNKVDDIIELKGFDEKTLYKYVSKAKALIYPSHQDSFSLVVLETLALGTSVVAYNIPAIISVYRNLKPVKIVREGNIEQMVSELLNILNQDDGKYLEEHMSINNFLELHSSWKKVAEAELNELFS